MTLKDDDFFPPAILEINFTLDEIEERDIEVAAQPGRDDISVCTCTGFCLREAERNACPCRGAQQFCTSICHRVRGTRLHENSMCAPRMTRMRMTRMTRYKFPFFPMTNSHFVIVFLVTTTTVNSLKYYIP